MPSGLPGFVTFDGAGNLNVSTDENLGGSLSTYSYTGTYSVASNRRTVLTGFGGSSVVFYLSSAIGYTLEYADAVTAGTIVPQGFAPFNNATFRALIRVGRCRPSCLA